MHVKTNKRMMEYFGVGLALLALVGCSQTSVPKNADTPAQVITDPLPPVQVRSGPLVSLSATAIVKQAPDQATLSAGVTTLAPTASAAMSTNATRMQAVIETLKKAGVPATNIQTSNFSLQPQMQYVENQAPRVQGYQANNTVNVVLDNINQTGAVLDALVQSGANNIQGPTFDIKDKKVSIAQARKQAVLDARQQANEYAQSLGMKIRRVVSIEEGAMPDRPIGVPMMAMAQAERSSPVMTGENSLSVTVMMVVELE